MEKWFVAVIGVCIILMVSVIVLFERIRNMKKERDADAMTDIETGMGNLLFFKHHFNSSINDAVRNQYYIAYVTLDSSYLRSYHKNSSFEDVIKYAAATFAEYEDQGEFSARIAENGFAYAYRPENDEAARNRIETLVSRLNSFESAGKRINRRIFHVAIYHLGKTDVNCEILLFNLRKNCNTAFGTEKQVVVCDVHSMNRIQEQKKFIEDIHRGIENNEFKVYLQFIVDNKSKNIVLAEALSRWEKKPDELIGPNKYIENMEATGQISDHDFYMFELVCRQLEKWKNTEYENISISCNFTRMTLSEDGFAERLTEISDKYDFDKSRIAVEITEDAMENNWEKAINNVICCKNMGMKIYLDDLGSGYTSLSNLCDYPIDIVKLDRDILLKTETQKGKDLFSGVIALAHSLGIKVICEGVETEQQNEFVGISECDYIQGWYYSKAIPADKSEDFISSYCKMHN